ncbi:putative dipeptidase PepE [archaeon HR01]|nr:putative dipeptidase PepE [archaeon HR01]
MLSELDGLMAGRGVEALVCLGDSTYSSPELAYLTRAHIPRGGVYLKRLGSRPVLVVSHLDVPLARSGVVADVRSFTEAGFNSFLSRYGRGRALAEFLLSLLRTEGVSGRVMICGYANAPPLIYLVDFFRRRGLQVVGMPRPTILDQAMATKDDWELDALRRCGEKTLRVVKRFEEMLGGAAVRGESLVVDGEVATVGMMKKMLRMWCAEEGLNLPEGLILSVGPKSSDPHYPGADDDKPKPGQPILLDIFPRDQTGYMYDFTRTYVVGRPSTRLRKMFADVLRARERAFESLREGVNLQQPFTAVCRVFRDRGWPTPLDKGLAGKGFTHSLGHGVGLTIGEEPYLRLGEDGRLRSRMVFTVEPGLYDPDIGGVRIEDVVALLDGRPAVMAEHPPMKVF